MLHPNGTWISYFLVIGIRYLVIAGLAFLVWYVLLRKRISFKKIQLRFPSGIDYQREIFFSLCTMFLEVGILVVLIYTIPVTKAHLFFFFLFQMLYNVYGHLGWELFPKNFQRTWIGRWINTSVTHNQHHQYFTGNYGLYFLFWDRLMGTMREDYEAKYDEVKGRLRD